MNPEFLLNHFNRISDAPAAIPRLRGFVLDLAVRGQLSHQDPNDETASSLLKRIQAQREQLMKAGTVKKEKQAPVLSKEEQPFVAPVGWSWVRLDILTQLITKGSSPKWQGIQYVPEEHGILFVTSENVGNYHLRKMDEPKYVEKRFNEIEARSILRNGDILMNIVGASIGRTAVYDLDDCGNINQAVALIRLIQFDSGLLARYLLHYFNSPFAVQLMLASRVTTAQPNMSLTNVREFPVPIPPLAEQHRIVAKIDELMALCDQLETAKAGRETRRDRLTAASHHQLNNGADTDTLRSHAHFFIGHLSCVTARPDQVKQLRQTILNIAVRGQLVLQDTKDEPASELLKRIQSKRKSLNVALQSGPEDGIPFPVPRGWQWVRFGQIILDADAGWSPKSESFPRSGDKWGVLKVSAVSWDQFLPDENKQLFPDVVPPERTRVRGGDFLISRANTRELVAKCVVVKEEPRNLILSDKIVRLQIAEDCCKDFFCMVNNHASYARSYYAEEASGTSFSMQNVSRQVIYGLAVPLPPAAEQHRIVEKVNELMALCDRLEGQLIDSDDKSRALLGSVLHQALNSGHTILPAISHTP